jgi:2-octaprenyl-6-methoxyphenol hydroxylase
MRSSCDIVIAGGGVAGLAAAAAFGTAGFSVVVVDPAPVVTQEGEDGADLRSTAFLQPARAFLGQAGLWSRLEPYATPLEVMRIVDASNPERLVERQFAASDIGDLPFGWNVPNWLLRREMAARLDGLPHVDFRRGIGFKSMLSRDREAVVTFTDGQQVAARLVIAADGRDSAVRRAAGIGVHTTRYGQKAMVFAARHHMPHDNISTEVHRSGGPFTLVPLRDRDGQPCSAVVWMDEGPRIGTLAAVDDRTFSALATERSAGVLGELTLASARQTWPIISQIADRMAAPRVALVAEAAHVMPPIGAQGLNMSLADLSCLLGLAEANRPALGGTAMLDQYNRLRHPDVRLRVAGIDALNRASMASNPVAQRLRAIGLGTLHDLAPIRRGIMKLGLGAQG